MTSKRAPAFLASIIAASLGFGQPLAGAEDMESLRRQNAELRERLESVERDLEAIKKLLAPASAPARTPIAAPSGAATPAFTPAESEKLRTLAGIKGHPVRSSLDLSIYGYVKLDASYDDSRISIGNFARWVETESVLEDDNHFNMTANQTRLGLDASGPNSERIQVGGKVEIDFYGAGTGENKAEPMVRHAYLRIDWPKRKMALLAGQTWDIISPLNPNTVNYSVGWWQGNVGYRRPQLRLIQDIRLAENVELKIDAGVSRTITGRKAFFREGTDPDTGADAGTPTFAGRAGLSFPAGSKRVGTVGISGHQGREEIHIFDLSGHNSFDTWSFNADLRLPLTSTLLLQAEVFTASNFDSHLGGIGQGVNTTLNREIDTVGGWASLTLAPSAAWQFNLGASMDDPDDEDLSGNSDPAKDARTKNTLVFGNVHYSLTAQVQLALELGWLRTTYKVNSPGEGWRQQFALIYKF